MIELLILGAAVGGIGTGYVKARRFVREELRFVDSVQRPAAPIVVGVAGALAAAPVVLLLPFIGGGTAILFGGGIGLAVRHGAKDLRRGYRALRGSR